MSIKHDLSQSELKKLLHYNPDTGVFTWLQSRGSVRAGTVAGCTRTWDRHPSVPISINNKKYKAHRLAWLYVHGRWPFDQIDHIDGNPLNNRISNIRECSHSGNQQNRTLNKNSSTGYMGVSYHKRDGKYQARIKVNNKKKHLGYFDTPEEAYQAYVEAKAKLHTFNPSIPERTLIAQNNIHTGDC